jgi:hypothetical protein
MSRIIGGIIIGALQAVRGYPVFENGVWNIQNLLILCGLVLLWNLVPFGEKNE